MNHHYGEMGDVWKHLVLAEIMRLNPPRHYWETHAGSSDYPMARTGARTHGVYLFLAEAQGDPALDASAYSAVLHEMPSRYPGSPTLAIKALGEEAGYIFCDIDPESAASLRKAVAGHDARVVEADGVAFIGEEMARAEADPAQTLVVVDPFMPYERFTPQSETPLELAGALAAAGFRLFFWYAYDTPLKRGWAQQAIADLAPGAPLWCGDMLMPAQYTNPVRRGAWGCGIVLANATSAELETSRLLGEALERIAVAGAIEGNQPEAMTFALVG